MTNLRNVLSVLSVLIVPIAATVVAQDELTSSQVSVTFSDPSRPGLIRVGLVQGSITVKGTNRKDVLIVARSRAESARRRSSADADGLRRLPQSAGFKVEEEGNEMVVSSSSPHRSIDLEIQAPARTHLKLTAVNGGDITVDGVDGEIDLHNTNGSITATNVAGSVLANTTNGNVLASLTRIAAQRALAFTSFNGKVDVTLPAATKANVRLRSDNGDVYTDFPLQLKPSVLPSVTDDRRAGGRYRLSANKFIDGSINGGGPDIELRTFNSNVYLRKRP